MNNIKNQFSIKDLENLTGIKAHTIRIWEKRYNLLEPKRTNTNIRYYDLSAFQKLLNVSYLNNQGYKISKIAKMEEQEIPLLVRKIASENNPSDHAINAFKLSMLNFDQALFYNTYNSLLKEYTFSEVFNTIFRPLLNEVGLLWQTNTISPAHEHFLTSLIRLKLLIETEKIQSSDLKPKEKVYVLFLPDNEVHELGLMFINYHIVKKGFHSIFLGQSVPIESLTDLKNYYNSIKFISYFTVKPEKENLNSYLNEFQLKLLNQENSEFIILGQMTKYLDPDSLHENITTYNSIEELVNTL